MSERLRILIVDDQPDVALALELLLSTWGYSVRTAHNGAQALKTAEDFRPRVVLVDLGLPDRHGYDVARQLKAQANNRKVYFIAVTGWNQVADQLKSAGAGISHHLIKPVNADMLREILSAYQAAEAKNTEGATA